MKLLFLIILFLCSCKDASIEAEKNKTQETWGVTQKLFIQRLNLLPSVTNFIRSKAPSEIKTLSKIIQDQESASKTYLEFMNINEENMNRFQLIENKINDDIKALNSIIDKNTTVLNDSNFRIFWDQIIINERQLKTTIQLYNSQVKTYNNLITTPPKSWLNKIFFKYRPLYPINTNSYL